MKVAILYNKHEREYAHLAYLCDEIKKSFPESEILFKSYGSCGWEELFFFQPDIYFSFPLTGSSLPLKPYVMKLFFNSKVLLYRTEGIMVSDAADLPFHTGFSKYGPSLVDAELFWGRHQCALVIKRLFESGRLSSLERGAVVGYLRHEKDAISPEMLPSRILEVINRYSREKVFTFLTGFHFADYTNDDLIKAGDLFDPNVPDINEALDSLRHARDHEIIYRSQWIECIIETAIRNPDCLIIVKPHPVEMEIWDSGMPNIYVEHFADHKNIFVIEIPCNTHEIINSSSLLIHYGSTCLADAYLTRTYTVECKRDFLASTSFSSDRSLLGWPSHQYLDATEIPKFIEENKSSFIPAPALPEMEKVLWENFNLRFSEPYRPSEKIIEIIFSKEKFSTQSIKDSLQDMQCFRELIKEHQKEIAKAVRSGRHAMVKKLKTWNFADAVVFCKGLLHLLFLKLQARLRA